MATTNKNPNGYVSNSINYEHERNKQNANKPVYNIGSEQGYKIVNMLQNGQSTNNLSQDYRPSDGSVWTKNSSGGIDVMKDGVQMVGNLTYKPAASAPAVADPLYKGTVGTGGSAQPTASAQPSAKPAGVYYIRSKNGYDIVNRLQPGQSTSEPTDGSVWTKNADGTISVMHNGQLLIGEVAYQPPAPADPLTRPVQSTTQTTQTAPQYTPVTTKPIEPGQSALVRPSQSENRLTADDIKGLYQQMQDQQNQKIDYTVQQAVDELTRAQEDAQKGFESQHNQVNIDEAQARDAQVLYAAARGDRGGITGRQYNSIANTAANNRAAIVEAQQKLATDTARQIADLRAQGEFEKADALLQIAQQQLAQLWELQQYEDSLIMQEQQQAMQESQLTGQYNGKPTIDVQIADREFDYNTQMAEREWQQALKEYDFNTAQQEREWAYQIAMQSIQAGTVPDASTLAAAGIDASTASQMASIYKASLTAKKTSGGTSGGTTPSTKAPSTKDAIYINAKEMYENGSADEEIKAYLVGASPDLATAKTYASFLGLSHLWPSEDTLEQVSTGMNEDHFRASMQSIATQLQAGQKAAAVANVDRVMNSLSDEQLEQLKALCARFGVELDI